MNPFVIIYILILAGVMLAIMVFIWLALKFLLENFITLDKPVIAGLTGVITLLMVVLIVMSYIISTSFS